MRIVEADMIKAIRGVMSRRDTNATISVGGNTTLHSSLTQDGWSIVVRLHGHPIAEFFMVGGDIQTLHMTFAGYPTRTTRSRINALASAFLGRSVARFRQGAILVDMVVVHEMTGQFRVEQSVNSKQWFQVL